MIKQVIVVRTRYPDGKGGTFGLRTGKIAAQVAHASLKVFLDRKLQRLGGRNPSDYMELADGRPEFPEDTQELLMIPLPAVMAEWVNGSFAKIVLGVETEADLLQVYEAAKAAGLPTALITDLGHTEFHGVPTNTTVAVGPAKPEDIDLITGPNGLVRCRLL